MRRRRRLNAARLASQRIAGYGRCKSREARMPVVVAEDDPIIRALQVILDPDTDRERQAALADYYSVDLDFVDWRGKLRTKLSRAFPARFRMVDDDEALRRALPEAEAIVVEGLEIGPAELALAPRLKLVQKFGTDTRNIDLEACRARGVAVKTLRRRVNVAVAEHVFTLMLALAKRLKKIEGRLDVGSLENAGFKPRMYDRRHAGSANWARVPGIGMLSGATLGALGLGEIGREVAARAHAFGMEVLYHQRNRLPEAIERPLGARYVSFDELLARADFLTVHVPLTPRTTAMIDGKAFEKMKPGACVVNISRAQIIDREALLTALRSGKLGGAGLDVHYKEPSDPADALTAFDNVVLTPHTAIAWRWNGVNDMAELAANIDAALA
jgi:phosphoglycerate dehydrogenase-like enzyme